MSGQNLRPGEIVCQCEKAKITVTQEENNPVYSNSIHKLKVDSWNNIKAIK